MITLKVVWWNKNAKMNISERSFQKTGCGLPYLIVETLIHKYIGEDNQDGSNSFSNENIRN